MTIGILPIQSIASDCNKHPRPGCPSDVITDIDVHNAALSKQGQLQGQQQRQGQSNSTSNNTAITNNEVNPDEITVRQLGALVLQPNNNTSSCIKVWGIASGNKDAQGILGIPQRDRECDLDKAANDAFNQGQLMLGWSFKCNMKTINQQFNTVYKRDANYKMVVKRNATPQERHEACMRNISQYLEK